MVVWFEIPVSDMDRAKAFYEKVFDLRIEVVNFGDLLMGWFPNKGPESGATGTLIKQDTYIPSQEGTLVYFLSDDVSIEMGKIEQAGGSIYQKKTKISDEYGFMAAFIDSEGNRVALHSQQ